VVVTVFAPFCGVATGAVGSEERGTVVGATSTAESGIDDVATARGRGVSEGVDGGATGAVLQAVAATRRRAASPA
jgi:hypothetical protein